MCRAVSEENLAGNFLLVKFAGSVEALRRPDLSVYVSFVFKHGQPEDNTESRVDHSTARHGSDDSDGLFLEVIRPQLILDIFKHAGVVAVQSLLELLRERYGLVVAVEGDDFLVPRHSSHALEGIVDCSNGVNVPDRPLNKHLLLEKTPKIATHIAPASVGLLTTTGKDIACHEAALSCLMVDRRVHAKDTLTLAGLLQLVSAQASHGNSCSRVNTEGSKQSIGKLFEGDEDNLPFPKPEVRPVKYSKRNLSAGPSCCVKGSSPRSWILRSLSGRAAAQGDVWYRHNSAKEARLVQLLTSCSSAVRRGGT